MYYTLLIVNGSEDTPSGIAAEPRISAWWYVGHVFLWIITGLICYVVYKDERPRQARHHLITSIWLGFAVWIALILIMALFDIALAY